MQQSVHSPNALTKPYLSSGDAHLKSNIFLSSSSKKPLVMGILNVTPDSFSDGGRHLDFKRAQVHAERMLDEGADIIDIGGESTRPGSLPVSVDEELKRVIPILKQIADSCDVPISVDTRKAEVAEAALEAGASIINDVSGFSNDMMELIASSGAKAVLMHSLWDPDVMQKNVCSGTYSDVISDMLVWAEQRIFAAEEFGVKRSQLIFDPGIGFGKLSSHNLEIIRRCSELKSIGLPLLIGASRKNFIGELTKKPPSERLGGSLAVVAAVYGCADIVRVHDVTETIDLVKVLDAIQDY